MIVAPRRSGFYGRGDEIGAPPWGGVEDGTSAFRRMATEREAGYRALMRIRIRRLLVDHRSQQGTDALLALVVLVASLVEIAAVSAEWSGPRAIEIVLALACSIPLVWRRSHPIAVAAVIAAGTMVAGAVVAPVQGPFEVFVAFEIALYSVGVHALLRPGLITLVAVNVAGILTWIALALSVDGTNYGDWFPALVWTIGAFAVGRVIRSRNRRTLELERLTVELGAERDARAREAVTVERARIARELHDVVAHNISVMGVQAAAASRVGACRRTLVVDLPLGAK